MIYTEFENTPAIGKRYILTTVLPYSDEPVQRTAVLVSVREEMYTWEGIEWQTGTAVFEDEEGNKFKRLLLDKPVE